MRCRANSRGLTLRLAAMAISLPGLGRAPPTPQCHVRSTVRPVSNTQRPVLRPAPRATRTGIPSASTRGILPIPPEAMARESGNRGGSTTPLTSTPVCPTRSSWDHWSIAARSPARTVSTTYSCGRLAPPTPCSPAWGATLNTGPILPARTTRARIWALASALALLPPIREPIAPVP